MNLKFLELCVIALYYYRMTCIQLHVQYSVFAVAVVREKVVDLAALYSPFMHVLNSI